MKKILWIIGLVGVMSSCTDFQYNIATITKVADIYVPSSGWQYTRNADNNYFYYQASVPALTSDMFNNGKVEAYIIYNRNTSDAMQHVLPYVRHYEEYKDSKWNFYTETVDCVFGVGWVEFNFRSNDFIYEDDARIVPNDMDFRVVLTR